MFAKKKQPPIKSLIAQGTRIEGNVLFHDGLRIDGAALLAAWGITDPLQVAAAVHWLVEQGVDPARILLITFSRRAAQEMVRRAGQAIMQTIAELGIVFLMFSLGLEFSLPRLIAMRMLVVGVGGLQVLFTSLLFFWLGWWWGLQDQISPAAHPGRLAVQPKAWVLPPYRRWFAEVLRGLEPD